MTSFRPAAVVLLLGSLVSWAEGEAVEPDVALPILLRVLTYDRGFKSHGEGDFVVLVPGDAASGAVREHVVSVARGLKLTSIQSRPLRYISVEASDGDSLSRAIAQYHPSALLIAPGLSSSALAAIRRLAVADHLYALSLDANAVEQKVALLGVSNREGKPQIVLNIEAARGLNASFDNAVLKLARLVQ